MFHEYLFVNKMNMWDFKNDNSSGLISALLSYRAGEDMDLTATSQEQRQRRLMRPKLTVRPPTPTWLMFRMGMNHFMFLE